MNGICKLLCLIAVLLTMRSIYGVRFVRTVEAVGYPYYKVLFSLGLCKERVLFTDFKIYGRVKLNRIFDIYYRAMDGSTISRVEIKLVLNTTNCISTSSTGVGETDFAAILVLPPHVGIIFYSLSIFTCSPVREKETKRPESSEESVYGFVESAEM